MSMIVFNMFLIAVICVIIIDISGIINEAEKFMAKWLNMKNAHIGKPWSCSFCSCWWLNLLYLIITQNVTIPFITLALIMSYLTPVIYNVLILIRECFNKVIEGLGNIAGLK